MKMLLAAALFVASATAQAQSGSSALCEAQNNGRFGSILIGPQSISLPGSAGRWAFTVNVGKVSELVLSNSGHGAVLHELKLNYMDGRVAYIQDASRGQMEFSGVRRFPVHANLRSIEVVARNIKSNRCCSNLTITAEQEL